MDYKRIEWLFFIVFLLIDIYLGIEILHSPVNLSNADTTTQSVASIRSEMKADNIDLPESISNTPDSGYYLATKNRDYLSSKVSDLTNVTTRYSKTDNTLYATPKVATILSKNEKTALKQLMSLKMIRKTCLMASSSSMNRICRVPTTTCLFKLLTMVKFMPMWLN